MKALRIFFITLSVILALGGVILLGSSRIKGSTDSESGTQPRATDSSADSSEKSAGKSGANPIKKAIVSEALDAYLESSDGKAKEISETITDEDKDAVAEIIANNVSLDSISDMQELMSSGDREDIINYAQENFSEEDKEELANILSKYVGQP